MKIIGLELGITNSTPYIYFMIQTKTTKMTTQKYSSNQVSNAVARVFNYAKGFKATRGLKGETTDARVEQFTWDTINTHLMNKGFSPRHIVKVISELK